MSLQSEQFNLPLAQIIIELLHSKGFRNVEDLRDVQPIDLSTELGVTPSAALEILKCAKQSLLNAPDENGVAVDNAPMTAKDLLIKFSSKSRPIITFCKSLDTILGGGVSIGQITEFCGVPGIGKTQLGIQLALNVQIPEVFSGNAGEAIYIDTEGSFMAERAAEMANELSLHLKKIATASENKKNNTAVAQRLAADATSMESLLEGIRVFRNHDQVELLATINHLFAYLNLYPNIKLIVIDSIAFHFRQDTNDPSTRSRVLSNLAQNLNQLAYEHNLAVVVINHVTTKFDKITTHSVSNESSDTSSTRRLAPALGDMWSHCITNRVMLYWHWPEDMNRSNVNMTSSHSSSSSHVGQDQVRKASLVKSPSMPPAHAIFAVTAKGIRDIDEVLLGEKKRKLEVSSLDRK